ncbi:flagellar hook capping FlgD N-terminal domain-containing protein [Roseobacter sp. GAI101]|uniref:flagellar hook capping FlgD N-terminal domain-containing protein n=1 Tax=Roseobacter sp. (strain GAI101) TaxID=391589 RepID=UPI00055D4BD0|nr:flagellar hook capping FlgD N-terminal domain-containing protein [Roseobacter sp. GAI101]
MSITATSLTAATPAATEAQPKSKSVISSDFETFLKMLTTQARYQDPLEPIDSSEYSAQLAQFSMVEQQVKSNDLLTALTTQIGGGNIGQVAGWIGMEARSTAPVQFNGAPLTIAPNIAASADSAQLIVYDAQGKEVQRSPLSLSESQVQWAGVSSDGTPFANGLYTFGVESKASGQVISTTPAESYSRIVEARIENSGSRLILAGGSEITADQIRALRETD